MDEEQRVRNMARVKAKNSQMVQVPLGMLVWLREGLKAGRVAASPYALMDDQVYRELNQAVSDGEELAELGVRAAERLHELGDHQSVGEPLCPVCWYVKLGSPPPIG